MINGDFVQGFKEKALYFPQCVSGYFSFKKVMQKEIWDNMNPDHVSKCQGTPSRVLCDTFWRSLNYSNLRKQLGAEINFFDIGAGSGVYGRFFEDIAGRNFGSYTGIDISRHPNFPEKYRLVLDDASKSANWITEKTNMVISQSALEHVKHDQETLIAVTSKLLEGSGNFVQIHMVPAPASLPLYLWHGWRQYSLRNISEIASKLISLDERLGVSAFALGGPNSFFTHLAYHTVPGVFGRFGGEEDLVDGKDVEMSKAKKAVLKDIRSKNTLFNSFWAICIKPNHIFINGS
jgi:SAM-dependent methyltransferase